MWSAYKVNVPVKLTVTVVPYSQVETDSLQVILITGYKPGYKLPLPSLVTFPANDIIAAGPVPNSTTYKSCIN